MRCSPRSNRARRENKADDAQCESVWDLIATLEPRYTHFKMGDCELWLPEAMTPQDYDDVLALLKIFQRRAEKIAPRTPENAVESGAASIRAAGGTPT